MAFPRSASVDRAASPVSSKSARSAGITEAINEYRERRRHRTPVEVDRSTWSPPRRTAVDILESKYFDACMGLLIMANIVLMVVEADFNAGCATRDDDGQCRAPQILQSLNYVLLGIYTLEVALRFYAYRSWFFSNGWNDLDLFIVGSGFVDLILSSASMAVPNLQVLRVFRVLRLLRAVRLLAFFPELREMFRGLACAMRAMFWGVLLILLMLGVWSLLAVEFLNARSKPEGLPEQCHEAFSSITKSTLFFFQTIVAGDSWGLCAVPVISAYPEAFLIFAGAYVSMQLGFMNLILTVIVQEVADARENDHEQQLKNKRNYEQECFEKWQAVICELDRDSSGTITKEDLMAGFRGQSEVRNIMALLDIDRKDVEELFNLMDRDDSGDVSYSEFFDCLRKAHSQDVRTTLFNLKLQISQMSHKIDRQMRAITESCQHSAENGVSDKQAMAQQAASAKQKLLGNCEESLNSLRKQLKDQLEKMSQDHLRNAAALGQTALSLETALKSFGLDEEPPTQVPATSACWTLSRLQTVSADNGEVSLSQTPASRPLVGWDDAAVRGIVESGKARSQGAGGSAVLATQHAAGGPGPPK